MSKYRSEDNDIEINEQTSSFKKILIIFCLPALAISNFSLNSFLAMLSSAPDWESTFDCDSVNLILSLAMAALIASISCVWG